MRGGLVPSAVGPTPLLVSVATFIGAAASADCTWDGLGGVDAAGLAVSDRRCGAGDGLGI